MVFQAPAILTRIAFLKDGGLSLGFSTNELTNEDKIIASQFYNTFGYVLFKPNQFTEDEIPQAEAPNDDDKTPAQRLRAVLYVLYEQGGKKGSWDDFYRRNMEKAIQRVKDLLD